jgi:hypothetical protein
VLLCVLTARGQGAAPETAPPLFPGGGLVSYDSVFTTRGLQSSGNIPATARPTFAHEGDFNFTWGFYRNFDLTILLPIVTNRFEMTDTPTVGGTGLGDAMLLVKYRFYRRDSPHRIRIDNILRRTWKNDQAPQLVAQGTKEGLPYAKYISALLRDMVADSILQDSTAMRVQFLGRAFLDPFGLGGPPEPLKPFMRFPKPSVPLISTADFKKPKSLIRDATSWSAKSSAAFHSALDAATFPIDDPYGSYRYVDGDVLRRRMASELLPVHAFDAGNQKHLDLLDEKRSEVLQELAAHDRVYGLLTKRPGIVPVESRESFYVQAADIAAGIASQIYGAEGLVGVVDRFEYVTYNGVRVSRSDAEEEMRRLGTIEM